MTAGVDGFAFDFIRETTDGSWLRAPSSPDAAVSAIRIDSREALNDAAFFALRGARHDGHDHLADAVASGARLLIVDRRFADGVPNRPTGANALSAPGAPGEPDRADVPDTVPILVVDDTLQGLQRLGAAHRQRLTNTTVIAVTGSAGKTTTRRLIHAALSSTLRGSQSPKSFNNAFGVPLTLLAASPGDRFLVVEVGTNAPGEIEMLGRLVEPDIVVITAVGRAHLGGLGSVEAIAAEKASLIRCRRPGGVVIVRDGIAALEPHLTGAHAVEPLIRFGGPLQHRPVTADATPDTALRLLDRQVRGCGQRIVVEGPLEIDLPLAGEHNAINALAAVAVARTLGVPDLAIAEGLSRATGEAMRLDATRVAIHPADGAANAEAESVLLVDDAYNANPESMVAGLRTFIELTADVRRRIVVLGRMLELGASAADLHEEVIAELIALNATDPIAFAWLVGPEWSIAARRLRDAWGGERFEHLDELDDAQCVSIAASFRDGDGVLLKGSRGVALERIAVALRQRAQDSTRSSGTDNGVAPCTGRAS